MKTIRIASFNEDRKIKAIKGIRVIGSALRAQPSLRDAKFAVDGLQQRGQHIQFEVPDHLHGVILATCELHGLFTGSDLTYDPFVGYSDPVTDPGYIEGDEDIPF